MTESDDNTRPVQVPLIRPTEKRENPLPEPEDVTRRVEVPALRPDEVDDDKTTPGAHVINPGIRPREKEDEVTRPISLADDAHLPTRP